MTRPGMGLQFAVSDGKVFVSVRPKGFSAIFR